MYLNILRCRQTTAGCNLKSVFDWTIYTMLMFHVCLCFTSVLSQCFKGIAKNNSGFLVIASLGKKKMFFIVCLGCWCVGCDWCRGRKSASTPRPPSWSRRFATCRISCCPSVNRGSTRRRRSSASTGWAWAWRRRRRWKANHRDASQPS